MRRCTARRAPPARGFRFLLLRPDAFYLRLTRRPHPVDGGADPVQYDARGVVPPPPPRWLDELEARCCDPSL
eukprot:gene4487-44471_t